MSVQRYDLNFSKRSVCAHGPVLKQVIARIDFVAPLEALQKSIPTTLAAAISEKVSFIHVAEHRTCSKKRVFCERPKASQPPSQNQRSAVRRLDDR
jgi:hypothetical protein